MNKIFEDMKTQAIPDESAVNALMESLPEKPRKRGIRFSHVAIAAAAALSLLTITAGAASDWTFSFLGDFSSAFGEKTEEYNIVESASYSNSASDMTFELVGVSADVNIFRVMLDIFPPEGTEFTEENKPIMNDNITFDFYLLNAHKGYGAGGRFDVLSDTPQKMRVMWTYSCSAGIEDREIEFVAKKMTRTKDENAVDTDRNCIITDNEGSVIKTEDIWYTRIKTGSAPQEMKYELGGQAIDLDRLPDSDERCRMFVTSAEVGSMSVKLNGLIRGDLRWRDSTFTAVKTDGTPVGLIFSGGSTIGGEPSSGLKDGDIILLFDDIVNPADIASVTINGTELLFK